MRQWEWHLNGWKFPYVNISYSSHSISRLSAFSTCILTKSLLLFINKYLLMTYCVTSPVLCVGDRTLSNIGKVPVVHILLGDK